MEKARGRSRKIAGIAVLTALGLIAFLLEGMLPPMFIPGAKLGLGNVFTTLVLIVYGAPSAFIAVVVRSVLGNLIAGSLSTMLYSLCAGLCSITVSALLMLAIKRVSIVAICVVAAIIHNAVQNLVFCAVSGTSGAIAYLPYLVILGAVSGVAVGIAVYLLVRHVPTQYYCKLNPDLAISPNGSK